MIETVELAWAAGFFDGEGSTVTLRRGCDLLVECPQATLVVGEIPEVLVRFRTAVGVGRIGGPYHQSPNRKPRYQFYARGANAVVVLARLWPFLGATKRAQATAAMRRAGLGLVEGQMELALA